MKGEMKDHIAFFGVLCAVAVVVAAGIYLQGAGGTPESADVDIISRTEYVPGDAGQVIGELRYVVSGLPITDADCRAEILYPNKTIFVTNQNMTNTSDGTYWYDFVVPSTEGVYEYRTTCDAGFSYNVTRSKAFHVSSGHRELIEEINSTRRLKAYVVK